MVLELRDAVKADAEEILSYLKQVGGETDHLTFGSEGVPFSLEEEEAMLERLQTDPRQRFLLARVDGEIVGIGNFNSVSRERMRHQAKIGISVKKAYWGKGIGTHLMEEIIMFARSIGVQIILLEVMEENERAISLYERLGFQRFGRLEGFMKIGDRSLAAIYMKLDL